MIRGALAGAMALLAVPVLIAAVGAAGGVNVYRGSGAAGPVSDPSASARRDIPPDYLRLYAAAAASCPGLDWSVLAAVGKVETDHGRSRLPGVFSGQNRAGAAGPMQFLAATVTTRHPPPPGGADPPSRYHPHDAIHAAAAYLCDSGAPTHLRRALYAYNHSQTYVTTVLARAAAYRATPGPGPVGTTSTDTSPAARRALAYAHNQLGLPYLWGGNGPDRGDPGFDCSGLTTAAYAAAGITLPRTAHTQYRAGPLLPPDTPLQAGERCSSAPPPVCTTSASHRPRHDDDPRPAPRHHHPMQNARDLSDYLAASRPTRP